jgi:hypothetical protein
MGDFCLDVFFLFDVWLIAPPSSFILRFGQFVFIAH